MSMSKIMEGLFWVAVIVVALFVYDFAKARMPK